MTQIGKRVIYMETGSTNPAFNLAYEEYVLKNRREGTVLILWQNANAIIVGRNQDTEAEINREMVDRLGIQVIRRETGGGAVYHDLGNINYSFITDLGNPEDLHLKLFAEPIVRALGELGIRAEVSGRNDIVIDGRKVSGTAQRIENDRILHHGTLLFRSDLGKIQDVLRVDPLKMRGKKSTSVKSRIGNIADYLSCSMDVTEFMKHLKRSLAGEDAIPATLDFRERNEVQKIMRDKYSRREWNTGKTFRAGFRRKKRWDGGILEVAAQIDGGRICKIRFIGDFLSRRPNDDLCSALEGHRFDMEECREVLTGFMLEDLFGSIEAEEILDTMFSEESE